MPSWNLKTVDSHLFCVSSLPFNIARNTDGKANVQDVEMGETLDQLVQNSVTGHLNFNTKWNRF